MDYQVHIGDCRESLRRMAAAGVRVQTCVTSPPYYGLRDYGHAGQLGLEQTPEEYIAAMVEVFRAVRDVLADDGTLWLNIGDSYAMSGRPGGSSLAALGDRYSGGGHKRDGVQKPVRRLPPGLKTKDLIGIPWMLAFALRADGWYLRQEIIWSKSNPMPESVRDRCTKAHESLFLLAKSPRYYFDSEAIQEPAAESSLARWAQNVEAQRGSERVPGKINGNMKAVGGSKRNSFARESKNTPGEHGQKPQHRPGRDDGDYGGEKRNRRSVWSVATRPYKGAHFATFPPGLIEPCILAGSKRGDLVLDPFGGSGTTAGVALANGRSAVLCELNPTYAGLIEERVRSICTAKKPAPKRRKPPPVNALQLSLVP